MDEGWAGFGDWLGTGSIGTRSREYLPFKQARAFVRGLGLTSGAQWFAYAQSDEKPHDIPGNPGGTYRDRGWRGMGDWLGTGRVSNHLREYRPFNQARKAVRGLGLKSAAEWFAYTKSGNKPDDIPANPHGTYRERGWAGMGDWLGTGRVANQRREFRPFKQARTFAHALGLKSQSD